MAAFYPVRPSTERRREADMSARLPEHLARDAYVYIRQSTADQLANNPESRHGQYALKV